MNTLRTTREVIVIDASVSDWKTLIAGLSPDIPVILLPAGGNGLDALAAALAGYGVLDALHLVSHGGTGRLNLGDLRLTSANLGEQNSALTTIASHLTSDSDVLLYGCSVAAGSDGQAFVQDLSAALGGADIAASFDRTGPLALGGDWVLEYAVGEIETVLPFTVQGMQGIDECLGCSDPAYSSQPSCENNGGDWTEDPPPPPPVDNTAPTATVQTITDITSAGGTSFTIDVRYVDSASNIGTRGTDDIKVTYSGGTLNPTAAAIQSGSLKDVTIRYTFNPPGGDWDSADNTTYTVALGAGPMQDTVPNTVTSLVGDTSFIVNIGVTPSITSAAYNASTNVLTVTATGMTTGDTIDTTKLTLKGEGNNTYVLAGSYSVTASSATSFSVTLDDTDARNVEGLLNYDGTVSVSSTTYNLAGAASWDASRATSADPTGNGITVSNTQNPAIASATYDATTGILTVTGSNMVVMPGGTNDISVNKLTLRGEGSVTRTLTSSDVELTSSTGFSVTLNAADKAAVNQILNKADTTSTGGATYNLAAALGWNTNINDGNLSDNTSPVTVSSVPVPTITSATYNATTGALVVTGTGLLKLTGVTNEIIANKFTLTGEGGETYTLTDTPNVEITSGTAFTLSLSATDKAAINQIINKDGTSSTSGPTTYNLAAAEDWMAGAAAGVTDADLTGNGINASNVAVPAITSAAYNASTGALVVTGTGFLKLAGAINDIVANKFTFTGEGGAGAVYTLMDSANVEITSDTAFTLTLSTADQAAVNLLINKNGAASTSGTTYNLAAAENWAAGAAGGVIDVDATNAITASSVPVPTITSSAYDFTTNVLTVTGTGFLSKTGANNDVDLTKLTFTGEGGATYTLTNATGVEITSATSFTLTLSGNDLTNVEALLNNDGTSSVGSTTYNLSAAAAWNPGDATDGSDTSNDITVSNYVPPTVTSATYDASTNVLTVTGTNLVSKSGVTNDIAVSLLTLAGEGGSYALTSTNVEITNATTFSVTLNAADQLVVRGLLNKNGPSSSGATTYNVAAAEDWIAGSPAATVVADLTGNGITVSNFPTPVITSVVYDSDSGVLTVTGTDFFKKVGVTNDIVLNKLTFTGQGGGGAAYTLTSASNVEITSATAFSVTLTGADKTNVDALLNQIGTSAVDTTTYNLAGADGWLGGADTAVNISDAVSVITVSIAPKLTSATYNAATGTLVVTGTNMQAKGGGTNDITANKLTLTGEGGVTYTLTSTPDVELTSATSFTLTLSAADKAAINQIVNKDGTVSTGGTTFNLAGADDWNAQVTAGDTSDTTGNGITASNVAAPTITSATYNATTGALVVTGTGFLKLDGATNDIVANKLTFTGEGGATYTLTDSANVEITSGTAFTVMLSATDKAALNQIVNKDNTASTSGTTYNLAAAEDWAAGADAAVVVADLAGNGVTASNVAVPAITSATYNSVTGVLVVTGTGFVKRSGVANDIDISKLKFTGQGGAGAAYTLISAADVEITSATSFTVTLSGTDKTEVNALINKNGTSAIDTSAYNLGALEDWAAGADAGVVVVDAAGNAIDATINAIPSITSNGGAATASASVPENSTAVTTVVATDADVGDTLTYSISGGADSGKFSINSTSGALSFVSAPNFEAPTDTGDTAGNNTYVVEVRVDDGHSGISSQTITVSITNVNEAPSGSVSLSGTPTQGQTLTASHTLSDPDGPNPLAGVTSYQWQANGINIAGATNNSLTLEQAQVGQTITVVASYTDTLGNPTSVSSAATAAVANINDTPTGSVTLSGTPTQGQTLTASHDLSDPDGPNPLTGISYQWLAGVMPITGATASTLVLTQEQVGQTITVRASFTDAFGSQEIKTSSATTTVANLNDEPTGSVTISGTPTQGQILTASHTLSDPDGPSPLTGISYQWFAGSTPITGATASTLVLTQVQVGQAITVRASYTDAFGSQESKTSTATTAVANLNEDPAGSVTISGTPSQGQTLTASHTLSDPDGPSPLTGINYQWFAEGTPIPGATASTLALTQEQVGQTITVKASYTDAFGSQESKTSSATTAVANLNDEPTGSITIGGTPTLGQTLTASHTLSDPDGPSPLTGISYQWFAGGTPIPGATASTLALTQEQVGQTITVKASYTDAFGSQESKTSSASTAVANLNDDPTGSVTISGTPTLGQTLTANHTLSDPDGPSPLTGISYQWFAGGTPIPGATTDSLVLGQDQVGKALTVIASYTDALGNAESVSSSATAAVDDNDGATDVEENQIPGLPTEGGQPPVPGDGNGDGVSDSQQSDVTSVGFLETPTAVSSPANAATTFVSLVADSAGGKIDTADDNSATLRNVHQLDAPAELPPDVLMPLGRISFESSVGRSATPGVGITETFSLYVDAKTLDDGSYWVNGYWKQDTAGNWVNLANRLTLEGNRLRLDFSITDGGEFDADHTINGNIVDPGAPAFGKAHQPTLQEQVIALYVAYYHRAPDLAGLQYWVGQAQAGTSMGQISAGFASHPRFAQEYGGLTPELIAAKLYQNVLHRDGDASGIAYWGGQLQSHPMSEVVLSFVQSALSANLSAALGSGGLGLADYTQAYERQNVIYNLLQTSQRFVDAFGTQTTPAATPENLAQDAAYQAAISVLNAIDSDLNAVYTQSQQIAHLIGQPDAMQQVALLLG